MIHIEKIVEVELTALFLPDTKENIVFFDIETTGFQSNSSYIYLIGCILYEENWKLHQWFLDNISTEKQLLEAFLEKLKEKKWLIHFNGNTFDLPFVEKRCRKYHLSFDKSSYQSLDFYRSFRKYEHFFKLHSAKQKEFEMFLNTERKDRFHGGELIELYYEYQNLKNPMLLNFFLLHNEEDVIGLVHLLKITAFDYLFDGKFSITNYSIYSYHTFQKTEQEEIIFTLSLEFPLPKHISYPADDFYFYGQGSIVRIRSAIYEEELKYYYKNYKDYYYLPEEDCAIHKSVAIYVDRSSRSKAKASNCYIKKKGRFLKQPQEIITPQFVRNYKSKESFFELTKEFLEDTIEQKKYILSILQALL